ncbi:MAG: CotH kinase family protein [Oscillospiraceae bacterium]|nr:CotH kinase family protein [Oscillospiraceae bacterium]
MKTAYQTMSALVLIMALLLSACGAVQTETAPQETALPVETPEPVPPAGEQNSAAAVYISEVMASNKATFCDSTGAFPDWLELYNGDKESVSLSGWTLERDGKSWPLPDVTLAAGEYRAFFGTELGGMTIPKEGCSLRLLDGQGALADSLELPALSEDESACRGEDGSLKLTMFPTPGLENGDAGYRQFQETLLPTNGEPVIGEVMVYNNRHLGIDGVYYDWVEISNPWAQPVSLQGYYLSDKDSDRLQYPLPGKLLKPGENLVIYCSTDLILSGRPNSGFGLDSVKETLYLSRADGSLVDYVSLHNIPIDCSFGRRGTEGGFYYFDTPSPAKPNSGGERLIATAPVALTQDGVFDDTDAVLVELQGEGEIRYTLDGSTPDQGSALYEGPLSVTETSVLRAVCLREGYLPSATLDLSYILNEGHTLPVVSLVGDPEDITGPTGLYQLYSYELERPGSFTLFAENGDRVQLRCGIKLHGATSRTREKKSFQLKFADRYEGALDYDLFSNGVTHFRSILLRMPQEGRPTSYIRDTLMHKLAMENFPELPAQDHRYAVLYLNGVYWGIYNLREAHSETHYAQHYGVDETTVTESKGSWGHNTPAEAVADFILTHDMREPENYAYAEEHLDLESIIGWCILEAYSGNFDANSPNMRFYWTAEDQKLHYALVDLDLGMFSYGGFEIPFSTDYEYQRLAAALMENETFRDRLLTRLGELLRGPLSEAEIHKQIDNLAEQLRPETARDMERWRNKSQDWESMVETLHEFVDYDGGRTGMLLKSLKYLRFINSRVLESYFGDLMQ